MSAEIINLRRERKARARADKERQAAENRRRFGKTKDERERSQLLEELARARLDEHRIPEEPDGEPDKGQS